MSPATARLRASKTLDPTGQVVRGRSGPRDEKMTDDRNRRSRSAARQAQAYCGRTLADSQVRYMLRSATYKGVHVYGMRPNNPRKAPPVFERPVPPSSPRG